MSEWGRARTAETVMWSTPVGRTWSFCVQHRENRRRFRYILFVWEEDFPTVLTQNWRKSIFTPLRLFSQCAACPYGRFGVNCRQICFCDESCGCDHVTGSCNTSVIHHLTDKEGTILKWFLSCCNSGGGFLYSSSFRCVVWLRLLLLFSCQVPYKRHHHDKALCLRSSRHERVSNICLSLSFSSTFTSWVVGRPLANSPVPLTWKRRFWLSVQKSASSSPTKISQKKGCEKQSFCFLSKWEKWESLCNLNTRCLMVLRQDSLCALRPRAW